MFQFPHGVYSHENYHLLLNIIVMHYLRVKQICVNAIDFVIKFSTIIGAKSNKLDSNTAFQHTQLIVQLL